MTEKVLAFETLCAVTAGPSVQSRLRRRRTFGSGANWGRLLLKRVLEMSGFGPAQKRKAGDVL